MSRAALLVACATATCVVPNAAMAQADPPASAPAGPVEETEQSILDGCTEPLQGPVEVTGELGSRVEYKVRRQRWTTRGWQRTHASSEYRLTIECDELESGAWRLDVRTELEKMPDGLPNGLDQRVSRILDDLDYTVIINPDGEVAGIENMEEILADMNEGIEAIGDMLKDQMPADQAARIIEATRGQLSASTVRSSILSDLSYLRVPCGLTYEPDVAWEWPGRVVLPVGGAVLDVTMSIHAVGRDPDTGDIGLRNVRIVDPEELTAAVRRAVKTMAAEIGGPEPGPDEIPDVQTHFRAEYLQDPASSWPREAMIQQGTRVGANTERTDSRRYTRIESHPPTNAE